MIKVKAFKNHSAFGEIDSAINSWVSKNNVEIVDVKYLVDFSSREQYRTSYALALYREVSNE